MDKKSISEIKKLLKSDSYIDRIRGCYVDEQGQIIQQTQDSLAAMEKESMEKYCELMRTTLSGKLGRNLFNMEFPLAEELPGGRQEMLYKLMKSELKDDALVTDFFNKTIEKFHSETKYFILLVHGTYDIPSKGSDNADMEDASDYVYNFVLCSICPVILMKEGLCYDDVAGTFLDRRTDWAIQKPACGFLFPAFNDRQPDLHNLLYYGRKEEERHEEISEDLLGCTLPMPETDQKELFNTIVEQTLGRNCDFENVRNITDAVNDMIAQQKEISGEPVQIEKSELRSILADNGADQEVLGDFDKAYDEAVGEDVPFMAENIGGAAKLEVKSPHMKISVNADMTEMIKTRIIDGTEYLLIPVVDDVEVNGIRILKSLNAEEV